MNKITLEQLKTVMHESWANRLIGEFNKPYVIKLSNHLIEERKKYNIYPPRKDVFKTYTLPYNKVKIVILGQDPYHTPKAANGLAFSFTSEHSETLPPSLRNIYKEVEKQIGFSLNYNNNGDLTRWHKQGVFLLNTILTVREGQPKSHSKIGWVEFTEKTIKLLSHRSDPVIFMLWGNNAKSYKSIIDTNTHYILESSHPSPFSYNISFKDNNHFYEANRILKKLNKKPIDWR